MAATSPDAPAPSRRLLLAGVAVVLAGAVAVVYAPVRHAGFFNFDDGPYVSANPFVRDGLTLEGLRWAFLSTHAALWIPLSFTSHMIDAQLFGLAPAGPHLVNVAFHAANAVLLLLLLARTTGALAPSAVVAALFALHPLRVESVAWIAERKDVLSAFFGLLTLHAWVSYSRRPSGRAYGLVVLGTVAALLSKPMLVTLPVLLLLFDVWPLGRLGRRDPDGDPITAADLVREKIPLLALSVAAIAITMVAARADGALVALDGRPLPSRLVHAAVSYAWYVGTTFWPVRLAVFYPMPHWSPWQIAGAGAVLLAMATTAVAARARAPWLGVGLAWFVVALLPAIGLTQAGRQGMADRFTYLPSIGLLVAVVWTLDAAIRSRTPRVALVGGATIVVAGLAILSHRQVGYWRSSEGIFAHSLAVTRDNWMVEGALGSVLANQGRAAEAYAHYAAALRIDPGYAPAAYGLGLALENLGRPEEAVARYQAALRLDPAQWRTHNNLGLLLLGRGDLESAVHHLSEAVRLNPSEAAPNANLRLALGRLGIDDTKAEGYVQGLLTWASAVASDQGEPGGAAYAAKLPADLLGARAGVVRDCVAREANGVVAPFSLYVQVDAGGTLSVVNPLPPTPVATCLGAELRAARASAPPFAPFHAHVTVPVEG